MSNQKGLKKVLFSTNNNLGFGSNNDIRLSTGGTGGSGGGGGGCCCCCCCCSGGAGDISKK